MNYLEPFQSAALQIWHWVFNALAWMRKVIGHLRGFGKKWINIRFTNTFTFMLFASFGIIFLLTIDPSTGAATGIGSDLSNWLIAKAKILLQWFAKLLGKNPDNGYSPTFILISAMSNAILVSSYAFLILFFLWLSDSTSALQQKPWVDSVYFLGFILTLASLTFALGSYEGIANVEAVSDTAQSNAGSILQNQSTLQAPRSEQKGVSIDTKMTEIIVQNAIALSSTVVALFIRTVWRLFLSDPLSEIGSAQSTITRELNKFSNAMSSNTRKIERNMNDIESYTNKTKGEMKRISKEFLSISIPAETIEKEISNVFKSTTTTLSYSINKLAEKTEERCKAFDDTLKGTTSELGSFSAKITELNALMKNDEFGNPSLIKNMKELEERLKLVVDQLSNLKIAELDMKAADKELNSLVASLINLKTPLSNLNTGLNNSTSSASAAGAAMHGAVNDVTEALQQAISKLNASSSQ